MRDSANFGPYVRTSESRVTTTTMCDGPCDGIKYTGARFLNGAEALDSIQADGGRQRTACGHFK